MSLDSTGIFEVRIGGSDTANGGLFNPAATLTGNGAATNATTSSPVFTSASYNFVSGDVGAWLFIKSGTNWKPGWYQIASVAGGAATLAAGVGAAVLYFGGNPIGPNIVAGCATTASPTSASWTIDYSQQDAAAFSLTGLTTSAANGTILTSSATVAMIGNGIQVTGGTNFITGIYQIDSVSAGVSLTVDSSCTSAAGAAGTAGIGGGFASPGMAGSVAGVVNRVLWKYSATSYVATTASTNVATGCVLGKDFQSWCGYDVSRWVFNLDANRPTFKIGSGVSSATLFAGTNNQPVLQNVILDGNNETSSKGAFFSGLFFRVKAMNFNNGGLTQNASTQAIGCEITGCSSVAACNITYVSFSSSHDNTISGFTNGMIYNNCLSYNNSGGSSSGFTSGLAVKFTNCTTYNNGLHGIDVGNSDIVSMENCIAESNAGYGFKGNVANLALVNCASYANVSGRTNTSGIFFGDINPINGTSSFFTDAAGGDFSLNNDAGAGAACRAAAFPRNFPAGGLSYLDIGALQHQDSGSSVIGVFSMGAFQMGKMWQSTPY